MSIKSNYYKTEVRSYYDGFARHLLKDYVYGNKRIEFAIRHALMFIPSGASRVLDIGCGIGWSTWTFKRYLKTSHLVGVDLGYRNITIAKMLFQEESLQFSAVDLLEDNALIDGVYDAIVLLDVYEHFRREDRPRIHQVINQHLSESGILFMSYPSVSGKFYDYSERPELLQPVDEFVTEEDIEKLAKDIHGNIVFNKEVGIFAPNDYAYATISRAKSIPTSMLDPNTEQCFEPLSVRNRRVQERLNTRVTPSGTMLPMKDGPAICLILSENFSDRQILRRMFVEALPKPVRILSGENSRFESDDGKPLVPESRILKRLQHAIRRRSRVCLIEPAIEDAFLGYCRQNAISQVVVDTLAGASAFIPLCKRMGIRLSVWFPGLDEVMPDMTLLDTESNIAQSVHAFLCVSARVSKLLGELDIPKDNIHYIPYGVDNRLFSEIFPEKSERLLVSVHDSLQTEESDLVLLAFREVLQSYPDARLLMMGNAYLARRCTRIGTWLKISHAIEFRSLVTETDLAEVLKQASAFICIQQADFGTREQLLYGVLAAMSAGLPVIATPSSVMTELIDDDCVALVGGDNVEELAQEICLIFDDPQKAGKMGAAARRLASSRYRLDENLSSFLAALQ